MYDFSKDLGPGESLLWSDRTNDIKVLDKEYKQSVITKTVILSLVFIAFICLYIAKNINEPNGGVKLSLILILVIVGFLANTGSFYQVKKLREYSYAITNKRIIVHADVCRSIEYSQIKKAAVVTDAAGQTSILINKAAESKPKDIRKLAEKCMMNDDERFVASVAIYAIPNANAVLSLLEEKLPL